MAILQAELKLYRSSVINDTNASNGGEMSINEAASGVANNLFPDVSEAERTAGITRYRKGFYKAANADTPVIGLSSPRLFIPFQTDATDLVSFFVGTQDDTQAATTASAPDQYGCGQLNANISAAAVTLDVAVEDWSSSEVFRVGGLVRISDQPTVGGAGNEEFVTLDTVTPVGDIITLVWTGGLTNGYVAAATKVSSVYEPASQIIATVDAGYVATTAGTGDYNEGASPIEANNVGGVFDTWTLTFSNATAFTCVGSISGNVGSGAIGGDFAPTNADFSAEYFTLRTAGWTGVWANNDTLVFVTQPAAVPLWFKQVVPAGATIASGNSFEIAVDGQTA